MNQNKLKTLEFLKDTFSKHTNRVYIVGGFVRDNILKIDNDDIDLEVYDIKEDKFSEIMDSIGAVGVGKSFFVYKYEGIDIALPRSEKKVGYGHRGFEVDIVNDEKQASSRRDFTMNALMQNLFTGEILDFWGGIRDINSKTIKVIDEKSFVEDSLRVLRGIRFASKFGFKIDRNSFKLMQNISLDDLSSERISQELELIFDTHYLEYGFFYLFKIGFFEKYFKCHITQKDFFTIFRLLRAKKPFFTQELYPFYMLYIIGSYTKLNLDIVKSNKYKKILLLHHKLDLCISDRELCIIALEIPISKWLGALSEDIIQRAKKLEIYDDILDCKIDIQGIINDGFIAKEIKKEIFNRKLKYIDDKIIKRICPKET